MSLLYKRPNSPNWYVTKTRQSTGTANRRQAEEYARKALQAKWRADELGDKRKLWNDIVTDWLEAKEGQASYVQDKMVLARFGELLARRDIEAADEITAEVVSQYAKTVKAAHSAATANRHLNTVRAVLRKALAGRAPSMEAYRLPKREPKWLTLGQFETILPHLPPDISDMAVIAVQTGMRASNVKGLRWAWIRGNVAIVPAVETKTGRTYTVPLSAKAREVLDKRRGIDNTFVFPQGTRLRHWWEKARDKAGFPDIRWHDLRHTWASLHTQAGTPDRVLAQMGGWASTRMLENYAHLSTEHLEKYADNISK
jgi:integrase